MYHKYHSRGFVLSHFNVGEANKAYRIFTRDLGLIIASAQSVRKSHSKLKPSLTDYSFGNFSFIKSKKGWKITDAIQDQNLYFNFSDKSKLHICARFFSLLQKLLPDEEPSPDFFEAFAEDIQFLLKNNFSETALKNFECLVILKILSFLGYLDKTGPWQPYLEAKHTDPEFVENFSPFRGLAIKEINRSFKESQLI